VAVELARVSTLFGGEVWEYLCSGALETEKSFLAAQLALQGASRPLEEVVRGIGENFCSYWAAGICETSLLVDNLRRSVPELGFMGREAVVAIVEQLKSYIHSGSEQADRIRLLLKEEAPDTFEYFIADPFRFRVMYPVKRKWTVMRTNMAIRRIRMGQSIERIKTSLSASWERIASRWR
ncbi:MAG: hypothetical protein ACKVOH_06925, partial [Chlamydiales bacterium]